MNAHEIDYHIHGEEMQFVEIELDPQEGVVAESGSFMMMDDQVQMNTIFGDGSNVRNYIYIKDVVRAMSLLASDKLSSSQIFNLSSNDNLSINEILKIVNTILDRPLEIIFTESRNSDLHRLEIDNTHFINSYQNFSFTNIKEGIKRTVNHLKKHKK